MFVIQTEQLPSNTSVHYPNKDEADGSKRSIHLDPTRRQLQAVQSDTQQKYLKEQRLDLQANWNISANVDYLGCFGSVHPDIKGTSKTWVNADPLTIR